MGRERKGRVGEVCGEDGCTRRVKGRGEGLEVGFERGNKEWGV